MSRTTTLCADILRRPRLCRGCLRTWWRPRCIYYGCKRRRNSLDHAGINVAWGRSGQDQWTSGPVSRERLPKGRPVRTRLLKDSNDDQGEWRWRKQGTTAPQSRAEINSFSFFLSGLISDHDWIVTIPHVTCVNHVRITWHVSHVTWMDRVPAT